MFLRLLGVYVIENNAFLNSLAIRCIPKLPSNSLLFKSISVFQFLGSLGMHCFQKYYKHNFHRIFQTKMNTEDLEAIELDATIEKLETVAEMIDK